MSDLTDELAAFYSSQKIAVDTFACPNQVCCDRAAAAAEQCLVHGSEAHVGSRYGDPFRIVVLSLSDVEVAARLSGHQEYERYLHDDQNLSNHMKGTQEILEAMLAPEVFGRDVFQHFALARAVKCVPRKGSAKPPPTCFELCRPFVLPELEILNPHLVIAQGREAWWALKKQSEAVPDYLIKCLVPPAVAATHPAQSLFEGYLHEHMRLLRLTTRDVILLKLVHPSAHQGQWALMKRVNAASLLGWAVRQLVSKVAS